MSIPIPRRQCRSAGCFTYPRLDRAGITCNKNGVPFDTAKPTITWGIRLGSPAATMRGFGTAEFREVGELIAAVLEGLVQHPEDNSEAETEVLRRAEALCNRFPIYPQMSVRDHAA